MGPYPQVHPFNLYILEVFFVRVYPWKWGLENDPFLLGQFRPIFSWIKRHKNHPTKLLNPKGQRLKLSRAALLVRTYPTLQGATRRGVWSTEDDEVFCQLEKTQHLFLIWLFGAENMSFCKLTQFLSKILSRKRWQTSNSETIFSNRKFIVQQLHFFFKLCDPRPFSSRMWLDWSCYAQDLVTWVASDFDGAFYGCAQLPACASHRCLGERSDFYANHCWPCVDDLYKIFISYVWRLSAHVADPSHKNRTIYLFVSKLEASPQICLQSCWILTHKLLSSCRRRILEELSQVFFVEKTQSPRGGKNRLFGLNLWNLVKCSRVQGANNSGKAEMFFYCYIYIYHKCIGFWVCLKDFGCMPKRNQTQWSYDSTWTKFVTCVTGLEEMFPPW